MRAAIIGVLFVCAVTHTVGLKCYGGEALGLTKKGESNCNTLSKAFSSWCWQRCGAISYFEGQCGGRIKEHFSLCQGDQKGKKLCPELRLSGCNCACAHALHACSGPCGRARACATMRVRVRPCSLVCSGACVHVPGRWVHGQVRGGPDGTESSRGMLALDATISRNWHRL